MRHGAVDRTPVAGTAGQGVPSTGPLSVLSTFDGLNHRQQRLANNRNQFSLEPPGQGLCVGNGMVMEIINDVMRVYSPNGTPLKSVEALNTFFGYVPAIIRGTPNVFGPFATDPSCYYDKDTNRWFADMLTIDVFAKNDPAHNIRGGDFTGTNHLDLAVSNTSNPTGTRTNYRIPAQDDGPPAPPNHHCTRIAPSRPATTPTNPNA